MTREQENIKKLYRELVKSSAVRFPRAGERLEAPDKHGVYVIYKAGRTVLHVGRTVRGKKGLRQRLNNHLHGSSSFTIQFLRGKGSLLRVTHSFKLIEVSRARTRALLEAYAVGSLCPKHLGLGENAA